MQVEQIGLSEWDDRLPETGTEVFHRSAALEVLDDHGDGELLLLAGYKGEEPVALLPVFVQNRQLGRIVHSPPPSMGVPRLGPVLMPTSPKQRKVERLNRRFTEGVLSALELEGTTRTSLLRVVCNRFYLDPRPYRWADFDVRTEFTYALTIGSKTPESIRQSFSKSLRREIRSAEDLDVVVETEGVSGARDIYEDTRSRYEEQERGFPIEWEYVRDLITALQDRCRVYVARDPDGSFLGGITVLYSDDTAYFWQGGARASYENVSINSLIHWRIIEDIRGVPELSSVTEYDLMGANTERLCQYKSKFGVDLTPYYVVESSGAPMQIAKKAYQLLVR